MQYHALSHCNAKRRPVRDTFPPRHRFKRKTIPLAYIYSAARRSLAGTSPCHPECCSSPFWSLPSPHLLACPLLLPVASTLRTRSHFCLPLVHTRAAESARLHRSSACCCRDLCAADQYLFVCALCLSFGSPLATTTTGRKVVAGRDLSARNLAFGEAEEVVEACRCHSHRMRGADCYASMR